LRDFYCLCITLMLLSARYCKIFIQLSAIRSNSFRLLKTFSWIGDFFFLIIYLSLSDEIKILTYNLCHPKKDLHARMRALEFLMQKHTPDVVLFQVKCSKSDQIWPTEQDSLIYFLSLFCKSFYWSISFLIFISLGDDFRDAKNPQ
jgi:hypothetical protein